MELGKHGHINFFVQARLVDSSWKCPLWVDSGPFQNIAVKTHRHPGQRQRGVQRAPEPKFNPTGIRNSEDANSVAIFINRHQMIVSSVCRQLFHVLSGGRGWPLRQAANRWKADA